MKNLLLSLLLLVGLNQILARSLPWERSNTGNWWNNYDYNYDEFSFPTKHDNDNLHRLWMDESSEESKEITTPSVNHNDGEIGNILEAIVGSFLLEDNSVRQTSDEVKDKNKGSDENEHNGEGEVDNSNEDEKSNQFDILVYDPLNKIFETKEMKSSEEKNSEGEKESNSSEENFIMTEDKSREEEVEEDSTEITETEKNIEINDLAKSSEEKEDVNISENDIKELTTFLITLSAIEDIMNIANKNANNGDDDELKSKEVDEYLSHFGSVLDTILKDELKSKENKGEHSDSKENDSNEDEEDQNVYTTTPSNESDEEDDNSLIITTPNNDSSEEKNDNDDNGNDDTSASDSKENELNLISVVFYGINDNNHQRDLNDHKYEVIELSQEYKPTSAPYLPERASSSSPDEYSAIQEYVEIREDLDIQQDTLKRNELSLDKDFYTILSNNYDNESMSKFEKDIYIVHENLERIKRNINAMQNLHSKLYIHKLITNAIKDVQNKSK